MKESELHPYQRKAIDHIIDNKNAGLILDMGLGKTVSTLTAINQLIFDYFELTKVLIIAPLRVAKSVWSDECEKWDHLTNLKISKILGTEKNRISALKKQANIYILNRENVTWLCGLHGWGMLPFDMLVIDESSSFKNHASDRFKALKRVRTSFNRVVILTGTPAPNGFMDLWSQIYLLDSGERLGKTITQYRDQYFTPHQRNTHQIFNYKTDEKRKNIISAKIQDICISMKSDDFIKMPEKIDNFIYLTLNEKQQKKYTDFEREKILEIDEKDENSISAVNAAVLSNKLLQFSNGAIYNEYREVKEIHDVKLDAIEDLIEQLNGNPVIIAWAYQHDRDRLLKRLKKHDPKELKDSNSIKLWNEGKIKVLLTHPLSGGHGLNLQGGGNTLIWFGQTWSLELYQQMNARLHRQGQKKETVFIHHLVVKNTMDSDVINRLKDKTLCQESLIDAIKAKIKYYKKEMKSL